MQEPSAPPSGSAARWALIGVLVVGTAAAFGYVGGWLTPRRIVHKI